MLKISVDEGYAFDMLSIAAVKWEINGDDFLDYYENLKQSIIDQIGSIYYDIIISKEYNYLYRTNMKIYELLELIENGGSVLASSIHKLNMDRFKYKKEIQAKFFNSSLQEQKKSKLC